MEDLSPPSDETTQLFTRWREGDREVTEELVEQLYQELRKQARFFLLRERQGHTLQPTELVNEALLRLLGSDVQAADRTHFFALAARAMRRILVDHARRKNASKRLGPDELTVIETGILPVSEPAVDVAALNDALDRLATVAPRPARLVELRYFGGLTNREAADVLDVSVATAERDWKTARTWLRRELAP
ncbi:MAG: sigma-70 family RNA polymerase sigma factor [Acidobacteria bacterium]|nr:sigma-70 family RNA polymerase sigma factor [Acidobacteriota bacterium]